jgi:hypothetical protein
MSTTPGVAFVDTETIGLDPDVHPIWEVAVIDPYGVDRTWQIQVTARELSLAHPKALEIGRFEERYDKTLKAQPAEEVAWEIWNLLSAYDRVHLAGAVVSFDEERLRRLFWQWNLGIPWHYHLVDIETLAAGYCAALDAEQSRMPSLAPPWDSEDLSRAVGVEPDSYERHTALGDAKWAKAVYEAVMR